MKTKSLVLAAWVVLLAAGARGDDGAPSAGLSREVLRGFAYQVPVPKRMVLPPVETAELIAPPTADTGLVRLAPIQVQASADKTFRDVNAAAAEEDMSKPCYLIIREINPGLELRALGAPVEPATKADSLQANFPLVSFSW